MRCLSENITADSDFLHMKKSILTFEEFSHSYKHKSRYTNYAKTWFPLYPSKELAQLVAALITDGHIDWNTYDGAPRPKKIILYSNQKIECQWFLDLAYSLFNEKGILKEYRSSTGFSTHSSFKAIIYCAQLARLLIAIGVPYGDKTKSKYLVPPWILKGNKEIKRAFLSTLFTFDGTIALKRRKSSVYLNITMNKQEKFVNNGKQFFLQIRTLLNEFGVSPGKVHIRLKQDDKFTLMLTASNQKSVINFLLKIGFLNPKKQKRLENLVHNIYLSGRIKFHHIPNLLTELKEKFGTDTECVKKINQIESANYTARQFEHMRRGEVRIPIRMAKASIKLLNEEKYLGQIPPHFRELMRLYD